MIDQGQVVIYHSEIIGVSSTATVHGKHQSTLSHLSTYLAAVKNAVYCSSKDFYLILSVISYSRKLQDPAGGKQAQPSSQDFHESNRSRQDSSSIAMHQSRITPRPGPRTGTQGTEQQ